MFKKSLEPLIFYKIMNYQAPKNQELFFLFEKSNIPNKNFFSDIQSYQNLQTYTDFVNKYGYIYKSLPFVKAVYLCGDITFGKESNFIELFIVCKNKRLWIATFFSFIFFKLLVWGKIKFKPYFYITEDFLNLNPIALKPYDIYLVYWIAHLVPIYAVNQSYGNQIFKENLWIKNFLPNFDGYCMINIFDKLFIGENRFKLIFEKLLGGFLGDILENVIKFFGIFYFTRKKQKLGKQGRGVIISDDMLKLHYNDIRKLVNLKYKSNTKTIS